MTNALTAQAKVDRLAQRRKHEADRDTALKNVQWSGQLTPQEKAVLWHAAKAYGLDPLLREIFILGGNLYVSLAGLVRKANDSKTFAGSRFEELPPTIDGERRYRCTVKKIIDGEHIAEFDGLGRASSENVSLNKRQGRPIGEQWIDEMAQKRALARALRTAFSIGFPTLEECDIDFSSATVVTPELIEEGKQIADEQSREREPGEDRDA